MPSSNNTNGDAYTITEITHAWTDMGNKMWNVRYVRDDGTGWVMRHWARDELDAYAIAMRKLEGAE